LGLDIEVKREVKRRPVETYTRPAAFRDENGSSMDKRCC